VDLGVSIFHLWSRMLLNSANSHCSITKLMGESFKLHAQALVGYEDSLVHNAAKDQLLQPMPTKGLASVGTAY